LLTTFEHKPSSRFHCLFIKVRNFHLTSSVSHETPAAIGFDALCVPCIACPDLSGSIAAHTIVSSRFCGTSCLKIPKIQIKNERLYNSGASFFSRG
jgi:hypothetical protein